MPMLALLLVAIPPPPPTPQATQDLAVCTVRFEIPRGGIVVGEVCAVAASGNRCDGEDLVSVAENPAYAERATEGRRGIVVGPIKYHVREERFDRNVHYLLVPSTNPHKQHPGLSTPRPLATEMITRNCPAVPLFLESGQEVVVFAAGRSTADLGGSLRALAERDPSTSWLAVVFRRVR